MFVFAAVVVVDLRGAPAAAARCAALARAVAAAAADTPSPAGDATRDAARAAARAAADTQPFTPFTPLTCSAGDDAAARAAAALDLATTCCAGDCALAGRPGVGVLPLVSRSNACAA